MSRTLARECGFKLVFEYLFNKEFIVEDVYEDVDLSEEEKAYSLQIFNAVKDNLTSLENKLVSFLNKPMTLKDLYSLDLAIVLVAMAQIDILKEDVGIAINEAVRCAKKFSSDKSPSFVNGLLSSIFNKRKGVE